MSSGIGRLSLSPDGGSQRGSQRELFSFLAQMKNDLSTQMTTQNQGVMKEVGNINRKIDGLAKKVNDLQSENETLKRENANMQKQLNSVILKLDYIEVQSRRNNVRITGLHGCIDEDWAVTEKKVRSFLKRSLKCRIWNKLILNEHRELNQRIGINARSL